MLYECPICDDTFHDTEGCLRHVMMHLGELHESIEVAKRVNKRVDLCTLDEVKVYAQELNSAVDPVEFYDHMVMVGWKTKNNVSIKSWKAAFRKWDSYRKRQQPQSWTAKVQEL